MDACRRGEDEGRREARDIGALDLNRRLRKRLEQSEDAIANLRGFWRGNWRGKLEELIWSSLITCLWRSDGLIQLKRSGDCDCELNKWARTTVGYS
jgi:hypothetical protein